ncbi:pyridoxal-dependent decarboxylase, exosortase A system-associated [Sandaracinobacter neustonicus]|uniref:Pyridoxal-dependent decarboxylase, exosortase A system-associated n=1 Tax=Sandaracinobacter neustonicus TaxID=1715348 RepID=A0A501XPK8_9SPHN|nr:pyridoxal-dependent decarboxylase, exosortase A system-associated [Sandaracinobacter neustonicus]TPE62233.1 pyridoxal-dependent decarboxylase, exosortase A system-associated [Sandaracinobacter neustonicus]
MTDRLPAGFGRDEAGQLLVAGRSAGDWVRQAGDTPLFLYDGALLTARVQAFRATLPPELGLHYAVKANPYPPLLAHMAGLVDGFDVASAGEMDKALAAGMTAAHVSFAGPGKRDRELEAAVRTGVTLNVESAGELERLAAIAGRLARPARVALRVNPPFALKGSGMKMGGAASPFGVDAADAGPLLTRMAEAPFEFRGLHLFAGSQNLSVEAILQSQRQSVALSAQLLAEAGLQAPLINLGGGFGVPYFPGDTELDLGALGAGLAEILAERPPVLAGSRFALELGRWLVAEAGVYLCRITDIKQSGGEIFLVTDGGLHHQLAATGNFGTVIRRNYPVVNASRDSSARGPVSVVGCLCTPLDRLAEKAQFPESRVGDLVAVFMAGAYGRSASPEAFLGHPPPLERLI